MIKGHSYDKQIYYSVADRLINNTFLNKNDGIFKGEGNSCNLTYTNNTITIDDGFFIVQGGLTEIKGTENITVELNGKYCILVYELDMSKQNSDTEFFQGQFRVLSGDNSYPVLSKQKLTENNGVYQYEFARFIANTSGISNFVDSRTFLDYQSIFEYIQKQVEMIEDNSLYVTQTDFDKLKKIVNTLNERPILIVQDSQPDPIEGKTIIWIKPKG